MVVNVKHTKMCAFCKHWYDPTNSAIAPKSPNIGLWELKDKNQKCMCLKRNLPMLATAFCSRDYSPKL